MANDECLLSNDELEKLTLLVEVRGEVGAAERLKISRTSVLRLMLRRPVRLGTAELARIGLARSA